MASISSQPTPRPRSTPLPPANGSGANVQNQPTSSPLAFPQSAPLAPPPPPVTENTAWMKWLIGGVSGLVIGGIGLLTYRHFNPEAFGGAAKAIAGKVDDVADNVETKSDDVVTSTMKKVESAVDDAEDAFDDEDDWGGGGFIPAQNQSKDDLTRRERIDKWLKDRGIGKPKPQKPARPTTPTPPSPPAGGGSGKKFDIRQSVKNGVNRFRGKDPVPPSGTPSPQVPTSLGSIRNSAHIQTYFNSLKDNPKQQVKQFVELINTQRFVPSGTAGKYFFALNEGDVTIAPNIAIDSALQEIDFRKINPYQLYSELLENNKLGALYSNPSMNDEAKTEALQAEQKTITEVMKYVSQFLPKDGKYLGPKSSKQLLTVLHEVMHDPHSAYLPEDRMATLAKTLKPFAKKHKATFGGIQGEVTRAMGLTASGDTNSVFTIDVLRKHLDLLTKRAKLDTYADGEDIPSSAYFDYMQALVNALPTYTEQLRCYDYKRSSGKLVALKEAKKDLGHQRKYFQQVHHVVINDFINPHSTTPPPPPAP